MHDPGPDISALQERIASLEAECLLARDTRRKYDKTLFDLRERIKELNCLYGISKVSEKDDFGSFTGFQRIIDIMPASWQHPETTCVRLTIDYQEFTTKTFVETKWCQSADIFVRNERCGLIEVFYRERKPDSDEGPFLKEERNLLNAIAERLGKMIERKRSEQRILELQAALVEKSRVLEETNTALSVMLDNRDRELRRNENRVAMQVNTMILPYVRKLHAAGTREVQAKYIAIIEKHLAELSQTHLSHYKDLFLRLTPTEMNIVDMIADNKSTADTAALLHLGESTVHFHRKNIRRKLGLANQKINLRSFLQGLLND